MNLPSRQAPPSNIQVVGEIARERSLADKIVQMAERVGVEPTFHDHGS